MYIKNSKSGVINISWWLTAAQLANVAAWVEFFTMMSSVISKTTENRITKLDLDTRCRAVAQFATRFFQLLKKECTPLLLKKKKIGNRSEEADMLNLTSFMIEEQNSDSAPQVKIKLDILDFEKF